jgi:hypothetical protein
MMVLWMRTYRTNESTGFDTLEQVSPLGTDHFQYSIWTTRGKLGLSRRRGTFGFPPSVAATLPQILGERRWFWRQSSPGEWDSGEPRTFWTHLGFQSQRVSFFHQGNTEAVDAILIPLWLAVCTFGLLPVAKLFIQSGRGEIRWLCPICSYNLTGNTSGICPECGTAIAPKTDA